MPSATIEYSDGSTQRITARTAELLREKVQAIESGPVKPPKAKAAPAYSETYAQGLLEGGIDMAMGIPKVVGRGLLGQLNSMANMQSGTDLPTFAPQVPESFNKLPATSNPLSLLGLGGLPSGRESMAGLEGGIGAVVNGGSIDNGIKDANSRREFIAESNPVTNQLGRVTAEAGSLALGRAPLVKGSGGVFDDAVSKGINVFKGALGKKAGKGTVANDILTSGFFKDSMRGFGRAAETGIEGATLALLQNGDVKETAAVSAGLQLFGSAGGTIADEAMHGTFRALTQRKPSGFNEKMVSIAMSAAVAGALVNLLDVPLPGDDSVASGEETGFRKVVAGVLLGATVSATGAGRSSADGMLSSLPKVADSLYALPRGAWLSLIEDYTSSASVKRMVESLQTSPDAFSEGQINEIFKGIRSGNVAGAVDGLMETDKKFRESLTGPPGLEGVPIKKDEK